MREPARYLGEYSTRAGLDHPERRHPDQRQRLAVFPMEPEPMAAQLREMVEEFGVGIVGGCCGTTPEHLGSIVEQDREPADAVRQRPIRRAAAATSPA